MTFSPKGSVDLQYRGAAESQRAWRARALDRSLEQQRARSVARMDRLVAAARALANESGSAAFTVAQVAEQAGCSLKAFYRCFASKDDLLLALLEDDSRLGAELMQDRVGRASAPQDRLHIYVGTMFEFLTYEGALGYAGVLVREHRRLSEEHPDELDVALAPLVDLLVHEIEAANAAGVTASADPIRDAHATFALVLAGINDVTRGRAAPLDVADHVWRFVWRALGGRDEREGGI
jgi:AcrR family transcriptional regulator